MAVAIAEVTRVVVSRSKTPEGTPHEAWVLFSLGTGVRLGEARALLWEDIDLRARTATIRASLDDQTNERGPTKTRKIRTVDIPDEIIPILVAHRARQQPATISHD